MFITATGEIWTFANPDVRACSNLTIGRKTECKSIADAPSIVPTLSNVERQRRFRTKRKQAKDGQTDTDPRVRARPRPPTLRSEMLASLVAISGRRELACQSQLLRWVKEYGLEAVGKAIADAVGIEEGVDAFALIQDILRGTRT